MKYVVGIDEAGRGPVIGPMVYAIAACPEDEQDRLRVLGADDSKKLSAEKREYILQHLAELPDFYYEIISIPAIEISHKMLHPTKISLNDMAFKAARDLLVLFSKRFSISHAYIDLITPAEQYESFIRQLLPDLEMTIEAKADSKYPVTGAASIVAKLRRDECIDAAQGCGYPSDPQAIAWLNSHIDRIYGFPNNVRSSWKTAENLMLQRCVHCTFFSEMEQKHYSKMVDLENRRLGIFLQ